MGFRGDPADAVSEPWPGRFCGWPGSVGDGVVERGVRVGRFAKAAVDATVTEAEPYAVSASALVGVNADYVGRRKGEDVFPEQLTVGVGLREAFLVGGCGACWSSRGRWR